MGVVPTHCWLKLSPTVQSPGLRPTENMRRLVFRWCGTTHCSRTPPQFNSALHLWKTNIGLWSFISVQYKIWPSFAIIYLVVNQMDKENKWISLRKTQSVVDTPKRGKMCFCRGEQSWQPWESEKGYLTSVLKKWISNSVTDFLSLPFSNQSPPWNLCTFLA